MHVCVHAAVYAAVHACVCTRDVRRYACAGMHALVCVRWCVRVCMCACVRDREHLQLFERLELQFHVPLDHHLLEGDEVVDGQDLLQNLLAHLRRRVLGAECDELIHRDAKLLQVHFEQVLYHLTKGVEDVDVGQLVLIL